MPSMNLLQRAVLSLVVALAAISAGTAHAQLEVIPADWATVSSGEVNGIQVSMSGLSSPFLAVVNRTYLGEDFSAAPLVNVDAIDYGATNDWTATFDHPVSNLLLYVDLWRGSFTDHPEPPVDYTFDKPFTILSGLGRASLNERTLTLPATGFHSGILQFPGPLSALSVDSENGLGESGQNLTFGLVVPEPGAFALLVAGAATALLWRRGRALRSKLEQ